MSAGTDACGHARDVALGRVQSNEQDVHVMADGRTSQELGDCRGPKRGLEREVQVGLDGALEQVGESHVTKEEGARNEGGRRLRRQPHDGLAPVLERHQGDGDGRLHPARIRS